MIYVDFENSDVMPFPNIFLSTQNHIRNKSLVLKETKYNRKSYNNISIDIDKSNEYIYMYNDISYSDIHKDNILIFYTPKNPDLPYVQDFNNINNHLKFHFFIYKFTESDVTNVRNNIKYEKKNKL